MSEHKALSSVAIKDADAGTVEAVFATLGVIDKDGDVTEAGAFEDGASVRISAFGHTSWGGALPVGKGTIREKGSEAILEGQFFMDTEHGRSTFATVKGLGDLQEWSYGFDVVEADRGKFENRDVQFLKKLKVHEVSPVMLGAGVATRTLSVKEKPREAFPDEFERVLGDVKELTTRVEGWGQDPEAKEGRVLSAANRDRLSMLVESLGEAGAALAELLAATDPKRRDNARREIVRFLSLSTDI